MLAPSGPCAWNCGLSLTTLTDSVRLNTGPGDGNSGVSRTDRRMICYIGTASLASFLICDSCLLAIRLGLDLRATASSAAVHTAAAAWQSRLGSGGAVGEEAR